MNYSKVDCKTHFFNKINDAIVNIFQNVFQSRSREAITTNLLEIRTIDSLCASHAV